MMREKNSAARRSNDPVRQVLEESFAFRVLAIGIVACCPPIPVRSGRPPGQQRRISIVAADMRTANSAIISSTASARMSIARGLFN